MVLGNQDPHQVYVQVNALDPKVYVLDPTGVPCPHEWATMKLCDELSWLNNLSLVTLKSCCYMIFEI